MAATINNPRLVRRAIGRQPRPQAPAVPGLTTEDRVLLTRVTPNLPLLADLLHADLLLCVRDGSTALVLEHAQPTPLPSLYPTPQAGRRVTAHEGTVGALLFQGRTRRGVDGIVVRGAPAVLELFPLYHQGRLIAVLSAETHALEYERMRRKDAVLRRALTSIRQAVMGGRLVGGERLRRLGEHDGLLVADRHGRIQYISTVAENQYRRLGYAESLLHGQLSELDTNEYVCFQAMERNVCLQRRIEEQDQVWIKQVVPLPPEREAHWWRRAPRGEQPAGALIAIQDITDVVRKEQELTIKSAMIQEIHHRVKNNLQTIASLLSMQARRAADPQVADMLNQSTNRILTIAAVHEFLSKDESSVININEVCHRIMSEVTRGILDPTKDITIEQEGSNFYLDTQPATSCALAVNELLLNAIDHGFAHRQEGRVFLRLRETADSMLIEIQDNGEGLPPDFDLRTSSNLGLQIVQTLVRNDLKGEFELLNDGGVTAVISLPRSRLREPPVRGQA